MAGFRDMNPDTRLAEDIISNIVICVQFQALVLTFKAAKFISRCLALSPVLIWYNRLALERQAFSF